MGMTHAELAYWGPRPYQCTLVDDYGYPLGTIYPDGTITLLEPSNVGKHDSAGNVIVWDGCKPDFYPNGKTKGRLLAFMGPRYVDSLTVFSHLARHIDPADDVDETQEGRKIAQSRTPKSHQPQGQPTAQRTRKKSHHHKEDQ